MSKKLQKSLQDYLSKMKISSPKPQFSINSKKWIPTGCKHPKTLSFAIDNGDENKCVHQETECDKSAATLSDVDRFLLENFKSLYIEDDDDDNDDDDDEEEEDRGEMKSPAGVFFESPRFIKTPPYLSGSNRFFVATGLSSSLIEEARNSGVTTNNTFMSMSEDRGSFSTATSMNNNNNTSSSNHSIKMQPQRNESNSYGDGDESRSIHNECIAVLTCSPNPHDDFRRSMQEMVDARLKHHSKIDWDFMEELLFCYLNLNDKKAYKFVLSAFVDIVVELRRNDGKNPAPRASRNTKGDVKCKKSRRTRHNNVT